MQNSKITKLKAQRAKQHRLVSQERHNQEIEALSDVKASIQDLYSLINDQEKFDANKLSEQIETLAKSLDIQDQIASIKEALADLNPQVTVEKVDLEPLLKAIESNKPKDIDLSKLEKAIIEVRQRVQESSVVEQAPEEFQPVRRVVKVGNRLIFDDQPTSATRAGGGSSSSSSGGITDTELRATPVPIQARTTSTSNLTSVNAATSSTQLLANNTERRVAKFYNASTDILYLAEFTSASTTAYTTQMASGDFYETYYTGAIFGIWAGTNASVKITEETWA